MWSVMSSASYEREKNFENEYVIYGHHVYKEIWEALMNGIIALGFALQLVAIHSCY